MSRCHIHLPIIDSAGNVFPYASVTLNDASTGAPLTEDVFVQAEGGNPVSFPLFMDPAVIDLWTDEAVRVQIIAEVSDNTRLILNGIDILPPPDVIVRTAAPVAITGAESIDTTAVLMSAERGHAVFRVTDPVGTHEHEGDSSGSVVLTGEPPADFNPYQSWIGYQAGENSSPSSVGSSAMGAHAELYGASSTILGIAAITGHSTGVSGDMATVLSSKDGDATYSSTVAGPQNATALGREMTVLGGYGSATSNAVGSVLLGAGSSVGAAGVVKIGVNHTTSTGAGANQVVIGNANSGQVNRLPWAGDQHPIALGANISLAGDPSDQASTDDVFCAIGPLAMGTNSTSFSPSLTLLQGNAVTQMALRAQGDVVVNGQRTYQNTTTTLGFFGAVGDVRKKITYDPADYANPLLVSLMQALSKTGLIYTNDVPQVLESGHHDDGTRLEFAETGQALQWKLPTTSPDYRVNNDFTIASNKIVLNSANLPFPTMGVPGIYSAALSDVICQGQFTYNPTGTNAIWNAEFETDANGWTDWDGGTVLARDNTYAKFGNYSLKLTPDGTSTYNRAAFTFTTTAGTNVNFSVHVRPQQNYKVGLVIEWFTNTWAFISNSKLIVTAPTLNDWTRLNIGGLAPAGAINAAVTVGYCNDDSVNVPASAVMHIDGAMLSTGSQTLQPYVDSGGYHPHDDATGLMIRCLHEKSIVGGFTVATLKGYLIGRRYVYSMAGNTITGTVATHSVPVTTGQILQADCSGTSVIVRANGTQISTFTDSTWTTRVKFGYRITETTKASDFLVLPFGF